MPKGVHNNHKKGSEHPKWNGGRRIKPEGYVMINVGPCEERYEHVVIIENVLGKALIKGVVTHHVDGNRSNNKNNNLVVCESHAYHKLIHNRKTAIENTGNPRSRKCCLCHKWDLLENLYINESCGSARHRECHARYCRERKNKKMVEALYLVKIKTP